MRKVHGHAFSNYAPLGFLTSTSYSSYYCRHCRCACKLALWGMTSCVCNASDLHATWQERRGCTAIGSLAECPINHHPQNSTQSPCDRTVRYEQLSFVVFCYRMTRAIPGRATGTPFSSESPRSSMHAAKPSYIQPGQDRKDAPATTCPGMNLSAQPNNYSKKIFS